MEQKPNTETIIIYNSYTTRPTYQNMGLYCQNQERLFQQMLMQQQQNNLQAGTTHKGDTMWYAG